MMSEIDEIIKVYNENIDDLECVIAARAELAQLRATVAEQARQLVELRGLSTELVNALGYWLDLENEPQECVKAELALGAWLAAPAPAPQAEQPQPATIDERDARMWDE